MPRLTGVKGIFPADPTLAAIVRPGHIWTMLLAFTTVSTKAAATKLARGAVQARLAACVQVEGPILSCYEWAEKLETSREYRLVFKCLPRQTRPLETWVLKHHPYDTPEWLVVRAERVGEKYLSWAQANSTHAPSSNQ